MPSQAAGSVALLPEHRYNCQRTDQPSPTIVSLARSQDLNLTVGYLWVTVQLHKERDPVPPIGRIPRGIRYQITRII